MLRGISYVVKTTLVLSLGIFNSWSYLQAGVEVDGRVVISNEEVLFPKMDPRADRMQVKPVPKELLNNAHETEDYFRRPIPKKIHQIWIGPRQVPSHTQIWKGYARRHGFEYKLWREGDIEALQLQNKAIYDASDSGLGYAGKADIARYEILYKEGGVYIDADILPFDIDRDLFSYFAPYNAVFYPEWDARKVGASMALFVQNNFMAVAPQHPIMRRIINSIPENFQAVKPPHTNGGPMMMTGPFLLTRSLFGSFTIMASGTFMGFDRDLDEIVPVSHHASVLYTAVSFDDYRSYIQLPDVTFANENTTEQFNLPPNTENNLIDLKKVVNQTFFYNHESRRTRTLLIQDLTLNATDNNLQYPLKRNSLIVHKSSLGSLRLNGLLVMGRGDMRNLGDHLMRTKNNINLCDALEECRQDSQCQGVMYISEKEEFIRSGQEVSTVYFLNSSDFVLGKIEDLAGAIVFKK